MGKFAIRLTVILVSLYMIACYVLAVCSDINLWSHTYTVLFELCVCICISAQGTYHCKFIKWTAYSILTADALTSIDELFDILPYTIVAFAPAIIIAFGLLTTITLATRHYIKVKKHKRRWENPKRRF